MSILIKLYVLSDFFSDFKVLNIHFSEKKNSFEPTLFQLPNIQNITKQY